MEKISVAILGATGAVGQKFAMLLEDHPYFEVEELFASEKSAGIEYGSIHWLQNSPMPEKLKHKKVKPISAGVSSTLCFSALDAVIAERVEKELADHGHWVVTNTKSHRMNPAVPLMVPEINWDTWKLVKKQWKRGGIIANPNCCAVGLSLALFPLYQRFGIESVKVVTLQAISGAGYPGVASLDIFDNVIPHIQDEVEKIEEELPKIFGEQLEGRSMTISAQVNRVPVLDGHVLAMSVKLKEEVKREDVELAWSEYASQLPWEDLPSAPGKLYYLEKNPFMPQPRLHRDRGKGMALTVGPLSSCSVLDWKFTALVHNTIRGAAGGALLIAEALYREGVLVEEIEDAALCNAKSTCS